MGLRGKISQRGMFSQLGEFFAKSRDFFKLGRGKRERPGGSKGGWEGEIFEGLTEEGGRGLGDRKMGEGKTKVLKKTGGGLKRGGGVGSKRGRQDRLSRPKREME